MCTHNKVPKVSLYPRAELFHQPPLCLGNSLKENQQLWGIYFPQTVQIMIGVVVFLFGIVTAFYASTISTFSGIMFWGAIIYITAGSLTVRANKKLNQCLVKASLGMNILSTTTAGIAIILHSLDLTVSIYPYNACYGESYYCRRNNALLWGIAGVMLVLSLLEFIVSIWVSAFPCKATCSSNTEQVVYVSSQVPPSFPTSQPSAPPQSTQMPFFPTSVVPPLQNCSVHG
ncbi:membrane-spanning 4-domains subfamily A member 12-like isoform X3 [Clupea harengus]|nr:membrane-spanning 4-domains subfamily A member 12-like isoform X3 [Clupea harengus]